MGYQETLMHGRYTKLANFAKRVGSTRRKEETEEETRKKQRKKVNREIVGKRWRGKWYDRFSRFVSWTWKHTFAIIGEDWTFLALLGIIMSFISYVQDIAIEFIAHARMYMFNQLDQHIFLQYLAWTTSPVMLILFAAGFCHIVSPQAVGSGIPEMKTILRGVVLGEYLSPKTMLAKSIGMTATLGAGMPLGKEGPFVHIASIVATLLGKLATTFNGIYGNESKNTDMLAAAVGVGVACCFASPIGGVLFSIEVTAAYFAVRNYWRGFFAAVFGAMTFRMISVWVGEIDTLVAVFPTGYSVEFPYDPRELFLFALIGAMCGLGGSFYVYAHRRYVLWMRANKKLTAFLQKNRFIYPTLITWFVTTMTFPPFLGQFQASDIGTHHQIGILFSNYTWTRDPQEMSVDEWDHVKHFITPYSGVFINLPIFIVGQFVLSILAATLPVPTGVLIPSFKMGAAFGRMVGEAMHIWFPHGLRENMVSNIIPGGYATVGAAAFTGAVTHTISISVIIFEMTGQITHAIPILIAVLVANAIASLLGPSCYDSIILIKKLPYLPDILPSGTGVYDLSVKDFMINDVKYIWFGMTFKDLREILRENRGLKSFPLVDDHETMILLGSIKRMQLIQAIRKQVSKEKRMNFVFQRLETKRLEEEKQRLAKERLELEQKLEMERNKRLAIEAEVEQPKEEEVVATGGGSQPGSATGTPGRRPSRFQVTTESGAKFVPDAEVIEENPEPKTTLAKKALMQLSLKPKRSILKKKNENELGIKFGETPHHTVHGFTDIHRNSITDYRSPFNLVDDEEEKKKQEVWAYHRKLSICDISMMILFSGIIV